MKSMDRWTKVSQLVVDAETSEVLSDSGLEFLLRGADVEAEGGIRRRAHPSP